MKDRMDLLEHAGLLQAVFENSEAGTIIMSTKGEIQVINKRLTAITGFDKDEIEGKMTWRDFVIEEDHDEMTRYLQLLRINPTDRLERIEIRYKDKLQKVLTAYMSAFFVPEQKILVASIVDITEQKESEKELKKEKEHAENSERLKTAFLANMSHEIRTPINSIVGFADLLKIEELSDDKKSLYIDQVIHGSHDLLLLIEKIITISRIDSEQVKLNKREFELNAKMLELYHKFEDELISRKKQNITLKFSPGIKDSEQIIVGDPLRLSEVLSNLLENAIKFTDDGQIEFGYYYLEDDNESEENESLLFFVKDSGSGIEKSKKKIIFDRFVKIIEKEENIYKGAGLGLSIASELVKKFNGSIWVESTKGDGSRFFFTYPLGKNKIKKILESKEQKAEKSSLDWSDKEILVAEDVESNYLFIKELLSSTNVKLLRARDGQEAVDLFDSNPHIDVVIMDILMPGMDGYEATTEIRKRKTDIPVIAQSAFTFEGDIQDGLYAGCFNDYIMKPYTRKVLMAVIKKHFAE